jgi:hypothetical protein
MDGNGMNVADKIACANTLAAYLDGTEIDLSDELCGRGWPELIGDAEFDRLFTERCWRCPDCSGWLANSGDWIAGHPPCPDCGQSDYWDDDEDWGDE